MDCGDSSCCFAERKTGMRTNGGCRCLEEMTPDKRVEIRRMHAELRLARAVVEAAREGGVGMGLRADVRAALAEYEAHVKREGGK